MQSFIWKIRFAWYFSRMTRVMPWVSYNIADVWLTEILDGDTSESPKQCAYEEIEAGL